MLAFHDIRLPDDVERGAHGGPMFRTTIVTTSSGVEYRNIDWQKARGRWEIGYGIQSDIEFQLVQSFFYERRGRGVGFRFKDWSDYEAIDSLIGTGNGANLDFQLIKTYNVLSGPEPYVRTITRPVAATLVIKVNDIVNANWTLGALGLVSFTGGNAPGNGLSVKASFEFDVPVRFDVDEFGITLEVFNAGEIPELPVAELRE